MPDRDIAEAIGRGLNLPVTAKSIDAAAAHFGWLASFLAIDNPTSSALTQKLLGWNPIQLGPIQDLDRQHYFNTSQQ